MAHIVQVPSKYADVLQNEVRFSNNLTASLQFVIVDTEKEVQDLKRRVVNLFPSVKEPVIYVVGSNPLTAQQTIAMFWGA